MILITGLTFVLTGFTSIGGLFVTFKQKIQHEVNF